MNIPASLAQRQADLTQQLIVDSAVRLLESSSVAAVTVRAVAAAANLSERTVFRYFPTRDDLIDAVSLEVRKRLRTDVATPATVEELVATPALLYAGFEAELRLARASLHTEISDRIRASVAKTRWVAVGKIIDKAAARRSERDRRIAAANIRFFLTATAWHYYRFVMNLPPDETVECAETAIRQSLASLGVRP